MPLFKVILPATLGIFFGFMMQIASFDLIPIDSFMEKYGGMTPVDPIDSNFEAVGFESMYILINLGTILVLILLFPTLLFIDVILRLTRLSCSIKASNRIRDALFFNSTIRFIKESYAITLMCCFINL